MLAAGHPQDAVVGEGRHWVLAAAPGQRSWIAWVHLATLLLVIGRVVALAETLAWFRPEDASSSG
jgi:hypothetical protein